MGSLLSLLKSIAFCLNTPSDQMKRTWPPGATAKKPELSLVPLGITTWFSSIMPI